MKGYSVGLGFDVHKFSKRKKSLILGGVKIPASFSLDAVSDGDLVLHAVCDAICGAAGLGDIGDYFPPQSKKSKNIDSEEIAYFVLKKIGGRYEIANIDIIIVVILYQLPLLDQGVVDVIVKYKKMKKKPIVVISTGGDYVNKINKGLISNGVPCYQFPSMAVKAVRKLVEYYS